jgi:hypothetical protein
MNESIEQKLKTHEPLIRRITVKLLRKHYHPHRRDSFDDYLSEARIAAWKALRSHQNKQHANIEYLIICAVRNHLCSIDRRLDRSKRKPLTQEEFTEFVGEKGNGVSLLAECIDVESALDQDEFQLIRRLAMGHTLLDLARERCGGDVTTKQLNRRKSEIMACLQHIRLKLILNDASPIT